MVTLVYPFSRSTGNEPFVWDITVMAYQQQYCRRRRQLGACDMFGIPSRKKWPVKGSLQYFRQQPADYLRISTGFDELQSSAVGRFRFCTMDYCTVKLAPTAAKLTVLFSCNLRREGNLFMVTTHVANNGCDIVSRRVYHTRWYKMYLKALFVFHSCSRSA